MILQYIQEQAVKCYKEAADQIVDLHLLYLENIVTVIYYLSVPP